MKLNGSDLGPLAAIAVGACVGAAFSVSLRSAPEEDRVVRAQVVVRSETPPQQPAEMIEAEPAEQTVTDILGDRIDTSSPPSEEPLIYIDGIRIAAGVSLEDIDTNTIERIEVVKGDAAVERFGAEASVGVVQIFLKVPGGD